MNPTTSAATEFRKKPVVVKASQWFRNGDHPEDYSKTHEGLDKGEFRQFSPEERRVNNWEGDVVRYYRHPGDPGCRACNHCGRLMHFHGWIETKEGGHIVCPGDWIITGVQGEHYPCKPDIFAATYELASNALSADSEFDWRPISSARKGDTEIWAYNGEQARMRWIEGDGYALWVWADSLLADADPAPEQPTYWMPIPAAPGAVIAQDDTVARTGNTADHQAGWFAGVDHGRSEARGDLTLAQKYEDACILANANAQDAGRYRVVRKSIVDEANGSNQVAAASEAIGLERGAYPTPDQFDAIVDHIAALSSKQEGR